MASQIPYSLDLALFILTTAATCRSIGRQQEFTSLVCADRDQLDWNTPSATRIYSILGPVHDRRRNKHEGYLESHVSTFVDRAVRDSFFRFDLSFKFTYSVTDEFLLGNELVSLEFNVHVWRSNPDLTYAEIERAVVDNVAPDRYRPHRGDPYGENETVFDRGSGRMLRGRRNIVEETSFVLWFTSTTQERELAWMLDPILFTKNSSIVVATTNGRLSITHALTGPIVYWPILGG
ncbi:hypothetical protein BT96DRAFT_1010637 [Gymnopus androsaceus JB14]|uniref:Uncharacterized protein n=1 Tax=Gymnopus androsaceus JB14 TaxID=1447944 RepID=A0A6A4GAG4_9AGAR|nr:hypothetical protein BT96DRAFT_1010637 [Gymnopus androsaceus JB14]